VSDDKVIDIITRADRRKARAVARRGDDSAGKAARARRKDVAADITAMNERYAVVKIGGKTRVASFEESAAHPGTLVPVYSTIADFIAFHANEKRLVETRTGLRMIGLGQLWIDHPNRRQYSGVTYAPQRDAGDRLNLWRGYAVEPKLGDCELYLAHLRDNVTAGNGEHFEYLRKWMARAVQQPGLPGEVAVVLRGREGVGKGVFAHEFGKLFAPHFVHLLQTKHLTGHFNAHLQHCSLLFADEAFFAGDRSHESVLKGLVTEPTIRIEPKGLDTYAVRNCIHLIVSSNLDWVIPAGADARRYFVLDVSSARMQDDAYFAALCRQMDNGGRAALLHCLLTLDIGDFNVRAVPQTAALADQKTRSRRGIDRLIEIIAHDGVLPAVGPYPNVTITTGEAKGTGFYVRAKSMVPELRHESSIVVVESLQREWGCERWKSGNRNGLKFTPLQDLRAKFEAKHGPQDWPEVTDWEIDD
jgi:hypothetical protein